MALSTSFLSSKAVQGYDPQFLNTAAPATPSVAPAAGSTDLTNRLLQIMSGQLGGTLSGGEKLSALGALLKSVSRGSQFSPQQVLQGIQSQKMQEVQGALQIQELRKAAAEKAQSDALKAEYVSQASQTNPQLARAIALMSPEKFSEFIIEQNKPQPSTRLAFDAFGRARDPYTGEIVNLNSNVPKVSSDADFDKLPSGSEFIGPDGIKRRKP